MTNLPPPQIKSFGNTLILSPNSGFMKQSLSPFSVQCWRKHNHQIVWKTLETFFTTTKIQELLSQTKSFLHISFDESFITEYYTKIKSIANLQDNIDVSIPKRTWFLTLSTDYLQKLIRQSNLLSLTISIIPSNPDRYY